MIIQGRKRRNARTTAEGPVIVKSSLNLMVLCENVGDLSPSFVCELGGDRIAAIH
jgi:hypothetical protein